ncbi:tyrosine-type recombinase/integrase [Anaerovorax odorimutans]|uniref:tyrosine-type recombinase/integrase n=1 Tax=Anaerovorax odorimutans TaxID=109327 RepID=UPI00041FE8E5|nr:tyrosine-type recombinase/integrase [Anaerovorax odorimutans]
MNDIEIQSEKFLKYCKNQRRLSSATVRAYRFDISLFVRFLNTLEPPIEENIKVTKDILGEYLDYLNENFAVKTVRRRIASIRSLFNYLEYEEIVPNNPFEKFHMNIKEPFRIPKTMCLEEISKILSTAYSDSPTLMPVMDKKYASLPMGARPRIRITSNEFIWARDIAVLELLFAGGLRVSELCDLELSDFSADHLMIRIKGKGNKERTIYLENVEVVNALNRYLLFRDVAEVDCSHIFISKFGKPLSTQAVRNLVEKYTKEAGITKKITPHVFRHSFASLLLEEGVDIKYIQDFLGHSSISTTQIYLHTTSNQKRKIMSTKHPRQKLILSDIAPMANAESHVLKHD